LATKEFNLRPLPLLDVVLVLLWRLLGGLLLLLLFCVIANPLANPFLMLGKLVEFDKLDKDRDGWSAGPTPPTPALTDKFMAEAGAFLLKLAVVSGRKCLFLLPLPSK
jgi:hypothetical protein